MHGRLKSTVREICELGAQQFPTYAESLVKSFHLPCGSVRTSAVTGCLFQTHNLLPRHYCINGVGVIDHPGLHNIIGMASTDQNPSREVSGSAAGTREVGIGVAEMPSFPQLRLCQVTLIW
jgi:hypothetical protein